jgi:hypothetical protein
VSGAGTQGACRPGSQNVANDGRQQKRDAAHGAVSVDVREVVGNYDAKMARVT